MPATAVGSKWSSGDLVFYNKATGVEVFRIGAGGISELSSINLAAASQTLTAAQSGQRFVGVVDAVFTLPSAALTPKGTRYTFETGAVSAGVGLSISPNAADAIGGNGLSVVLDKDLINSGASDRLGDSVTIYCTGVAGSGAWIIASIIGTFAKEA